MYLRIVLSWLCSPWSLHGQETCSQTGKGLSTPANQNQAMQREPKLRYSWNTVGTSVNNSGVSWRLWENTPPSHRNSWFYLTVGAFSISGPLLIIRVTQWCAMVRSGPVRSSVVVFLSAGSSRWLLSEPAPDVLQMNRGEGDVGKDERRRARCRNNRKCAGQMSPISFPILMLNLGEISTVCVSVCVCVCVSVCFPTERRGCSTTSQWLHGVCVWWRHIRFTHFASLKSDVPGVFWHVQHAHAHIYCTVWSNWR